jgi:hypothetical protein
MRKHVRRPTPAMLVAITALISSLAGPAIADQAASIAKSISGSTIKKGSITSKQVKDRSIKGADVARNALGGTEVNEAKLAKVPAATAADSAALAANATHAVNADKATTADKASDSDTLGGKTPASFVASGAELRYLVRMTKGDTAVKRTFGPLTITFTCVDNAGSTHGSAVAETSVDHTYFNAYSTDTDLNPGETATLNDVDSLTADSYDSEEPRIDTPDGSFSVFDGDGEPVGAWANHAGADCEFTGHLVNNAA